MKGILILAEAATAHPDGTISMLRAGIRHLRGKTLPIVFKGALVASVVAEASEHGSHQLELNCIDEDGKDRLPTIKMSFEVPRAGGSNNLIIVLAKQLKDWGTYQFNLVIDRHEHDSLTLMVENIEENNEDNRETTE